MQEGKSALEDELQTVARPASQRFGSRWPSGCPFTTLRASVPSHALQTYPPTGCKQPTAVHNLIDGSVHNAFHLNNAFPGLNPTHTYARSLGNVTSLRNIAASLSSGGSTTNGNTVEGYVNALCDAFLFRKAERYDIRGREMLSSGCKYYAADIGLRYRLSGNRAGDSGRVLENVVYLELLRRSGNVLVGQHDGKEVDFVTRDGDDVRYYQVSETVRDEATREREFGPLLSIRDHYPKTLITLDDDLPSSLNGVRQVNALDFLLDEP